MSLWYESLAIDLYDCGENQEERAKCILSHLSMSVPRSWWEHALKTGHVDDSYASVLRKLQVELSNAVDLGEPISSGLLVALAFAEQDQKRSGLNKVTVHDYLIKAKTVLTERPDLAHIGKLIDEKESLV